MPSRVPVVFPASKWKMAELAVCMARGGWCWCCLVLPVLVLPLLDPSLPQFPPPWIPSSVLRTIEVSASTRSDARVPPGPSLPSLSQVLAHAPEAPRSVIMHAPCCRRRRRRELAHDSSNVSSRRSSPCPAPAAPSLHHSVQHAQTSRPEAGRVVSCISQPNWEPIPMREAACWLGVSSAQKRHVAMPRAANPRHRLAESGKLPEHRRSWCRRAVAARNGWLSCPVQSCPCLLHGESQSWRGRQHDPAVFHSICRLACLPEANHSPPPSSPAAPRIAQLW